MKTLLLIDVDSDRSQKVILGKPNEIKPPTNFEEAQLLVNTDVVCVCEALCALIDLADQNGYSKKDVMVVKFSSIGLVFGAHVVIIGSDLGLV